MDVEGELGPHRTKYTATLKRGTGTPSVNEISCLLKERKVWRSHVVVRPPTGDQVSEVNKTNK